MRALQFSVSVPQFVALQLLGRLHRRLFYSGPLATLRLAEVPRPELPSPDWVKLKTLMCGLCGSDVNLALLEDSPMASPFTSFPCTIGHEVCAEVVEAGGGVEGIKAGQIVTVAPHLDCATRGIEPECAACRADRQGNCENFAEGSLAPGMFIGICSEVGGGFAPYLVAHKSRVFRLPRGMSPREGAMIEPLSVALQAVLDNMPGRDEQVLVVGGGVIGSLIVQSIRALGADCSVTVVEPSPFQAELVAKAGADHVITDGDVLEQTKYITGARAYKPMLGGDILMGGFSKVFDVVASAATLDTSMRVLATGGVLSVVGIGKEAMKDLTPLWLKLQTIKGVYSFGYTGAGRQKKHVFELAIDLVKRKKVDVGSMVTHIFPIEDYRRMIEVNLNKGKHGALKTAVSFE